MSPDTSGLFWANTMYRVYLRDVHGRVPLETKTNTTNSAVAAEAFAALVNRTDLDGQKWAAVLSYDNRQRAFHRFDRYPGQADYWRDRLDEIEWPDERPVVHGGSREGAGRPAETTDGGTLERKSVTLDATTVRTLKAFGDGELSNGIRRAARLVARKGGRSALPDS